MHLTDAHMYVATSILSELSKMEWKRAELTTEQYTILYDGMKCNEAINDILSHTIHCAVLHHRTSLKHNKLHILSVTQT